MDGWRDLGGSGDGKGHRMCVREIRYRESRGERTEIGRGQENIFRVSQRPGTESGLRKSMGVALAETPSSGRQRALSGHLL